MMTTANVAWQQAYHGIFPALWHCRLTEIKKWLGVDEARQPPKTTNPGTPALPAPQSEPQRDGAPAGGGVGAAPSKSRPWSGTKKALPRGRSARQAPIPDRGALSEWLALLNMIPLQGKGKGSAPIALYRVVLKYAQDRGFLAELAGAAPSAGCLEGFVGPPSDGAERWRCTLYDLLAATPGGAEELERVVRVTGVEPSSHLARSGDPYYDFYIPKTLRHATLVDVKQLMRKVDFPLGPHARSARNPSLYAWGEPHERWVAAACATRHAAVFKYALGRFGPAVGTGPYGGGGPLPAHRWWGFLQEARHSPRELQPRLELLLKEGLEDLGRILALARPLAPPPYLMPQRLITPGCDPRAAPDGGVLHYALVLLICPEMARRKRRALLPKLWWEKIPAGGRQPPPFVEGPFVEDPVGSVRTSGAFPQVAAGHGALEGLTALTREEDFLAAPAAAQEQAVSYLLWLYAGWVWEDWRATDPRGTGVVPGEGTRGWATALHRRWPRLPLAPIYLGILNRLFIRNALGRGAARRCLLAYICVAGAGILRLAVSACGPHYPKELANVVRAHLLCVRAQRRLFARKGKALCRTLGEVLEWLPPREEGPLMEGGGRMRCLGSSWTLRSGRVFAPPPAHCGAEELAWCAVHSGQVVLSAKADGVHYQGPLPPGTAPPAPPAFAECLCQAERVPRAGGGELWLVYDVAGEDLLDLDLVGRLEAFRAALGLPPAPPGPGGCFADDVALAAFLAAVPEGCDALWAKWAWAPPPDFPPAAFLELVAGPPPVGAHPCDGWICAPRLSLASPAWGAGKRRTIKIKPQDEMTADLLWSGAPGGWVPATPRAPLGPPAAGRAGIWRCAWAGGRWAPRDFRPEKERPNPNRLVADLERANLAPWTPRDLVPFLAQRHYASAPVELTGSAEAFLGRQRASVRAWLDREGIGRADRVFDAGCGRGAHRHPGPGHWTGVDWDPAAVAEARQRQGGPRCTWLWADVAGLAHPLTREPVAELRPGGYDFLVAVHSFHSAAESVALWDGWVEALTLLAAPGAVLCLRTVDPLALFAASGPPGPPGLDPPRVVHLPGGSWFRREDGGDGGPARPPGAVRVRTSLAWAASGGCPRSEWFVPPGEIVRAFAAAGWAPRGAAEPKQEDAAAPGWEGWVRAETDLVFSRPAR